MLKRIQERAKKFYAKNTSIITYTIFWLILSGLILFIFYVNGKSFLWKDDGIYQHFVSFNYLCDYLKDLIYNFHFSGFFNYTLGQGMDILTTLNCYDFTDPISFICALLFPLSRIGRYTLMIFIKLYLIGISFLFYCHVTERKEGMATVAGALAYVFCGAVLYMFAQQPNYINWAYFLPFLLGGVELYFRKQKKLPLVLFVFLNIITNYYTFYMNAILVAIYVLIHAACKVVEDKKWSTLWEELKKCLNLVGVCCIGILLSSFILFPTIYAYLNNNRIGELTGYAASMWHYERTFYKNLFENIFVPFQNSGYTSYIGFNIVLIIPLALIFTKHRQYTAIKSLFIISLIMMGIPIIGRLLNGFGYATNRWAYVVPFYASVILVLMFTQIEGMSNGEKSFVFIIAATYIALCCFLTRADANSLRLTTLVILIIVVVIVGIVLNFRRISMEPLLFLLVIFGACFEIYGTFSGSEGNYVSQYLDEDKISSSFTNYSSTAVADSTDNNGFYRTEMQERRTNVNGINHVNGTGFWWSMVSGDMMDYYTDLALDSVPENCASGGLDGRSGLLELASVKYYTRPVEDEGLIPYGYKEISTTDSRYQVYENMYALPIGYTYAGYIPVSEYETMNGLEKEQSLLQAAVIEENVKEIPEETISFDYDLLDYDIIRTEGVIQTDNSIEATDAGAYIDIQVDIPDDYEIYVYISGIELWDSIESMKLTAERNNGKCSISKYSTITNSTYKWPPFRDDVAFNLGSGYAGENIITLSFDTQSMISYDNIQIIAIPMSIYTDYAQNLGEYVLKNVVVGEDKINGTISVPEDRILQFSVPYSDGWKAYVDGQEVPILKSDIMYMAITLSAGNHNIELRYETPYLRLGVIVSVVTAVLLIFYEIMWQRRKESIEYKNV